jgi:hypothetical protein
VNVCENNRVQNCSDIPIPDGNYFGVTLYSTFTKCTLQGILLTTYTLVNLCLVQQGWSTIYLYSNNETLIQRDFQNMNCSGVPQSEKVFHFGECNNIGIAFVVYSKLIVNGSAISPKVSQTIGIQSPVPSKSNGTGVISAASQIQIDLFFIFVLISIISCF